MAQSYVIDAGSWRMIHIPFTAYFLARNPDTKLWFLVEKELREGEWREDGKRYDTYRYRFL